MTSNQERQNKKPFDHRAFMAKYGGGSVSKYEDREIIYAQGDPSDALFYIISGTAKASFVSEFGKEAIIAILAAGDFFGEGCLDDNLRRNSTISATGECEIARFDRASVNRALATDLAFGESFLNFLMTKNAKLQADLVDQMFNSSEKRLARMLLTLANSELGNQSNYITIPINQETLANMVGTTRSRINQFMNKFRKLGYIDYNGRIKVNNSLLNLILHDDQQPKHQ